MKKSMTLAALRKACLTLFVIPALYLSATAQQWSGNANTTSTIVRVGNVGIGFSSGSLPTSKLTVKGLGSYNIDMKINGRIQTGDASNFGGVWLNSGATQFVGQFDTNKLGFFNNNNWRMIVDNLGRVGIGTAAPARNLEVTQNNLDGAIRIGWGSQYPTLVTDMGYAGAGGFVINAQANGGWARTIFKCDGITKLTISKENVAVDGLLVAEEIEVRDVAADYVFEEDYKLRSLEEVETYIKANKHLPGVAPAAETEKGIKVGEFNEKLLEKIEELTLYVIELKKQNDTLKSKVSALETTVNK